MTPEERIQRTLAFLYGTQPAKSLWTKFESLLQNYRQDAAPSGQPHRKPALSEKDAILITYGNQVQAPSVPPLKTLSQFLQDYAAGIISCLHILPFFPYSSDDGFSVIDYRQVDPQLGTWEDIEKIAENFRLMIDAVINHISRESLWFQGFLRGEPPFKDFFIAVEPGTDLSQVVRPRALPLLTPVDTAQGKTPVWTTFSADQIDLNYANPDVLQEITDLLLFYTAHGAEFIRLDAIAYLWKEIGTPCIHLPQTHAVIRLFRAVLDAAAPHVQLITETNVPHQENVSYFGDGFDEAQLVYNFALPPLVLHAFLTGSARYLSQWANGLSLPSDQVTFFNFLASHDGIGLNPARGILPEGDIARLVDQVRERDGLVSYKTNPDGSQTPYELNINYLDALSDPRSHEPQAMLVDRFIASQAIMLALVGVPGIYFHSLFGSRGWQAGVEQTGRNRTINRQKLQVADLTSELDNPQSLRAQVFQRFRQLLITRAGSPAFHPHGSQEVVACGEAVFALLRNAPKSGERVLCLHNVSNQVQPVNTDLGAFFPDHPQALLNLLTGTSVESQVSLLPYETAWLG